MLFFDKTGKELLKQFEGLKLKAYDDGTGVWTIGIGTIRYPNGQKVKAGDTCTEEQAYAYVDNDLKSFENKIHSLVKVVLTQNQYNAEVCFTYNVGVTNFANSTLLKKINLGDFKSAADEFLKWNKDGGKVMKGLTTRREAEPKGKWPANRKCWIKTTF